MATARAAQAVVVYEDNLDGLADMVADLLRDNLLADPRRAALLNHKPWLATVVVPDAESTFAIRFAVGVVTVGSVSGAKASLQITLDGETLVELPEIPLVAGLPDPRRSAGRALLAKLVRRQVIIRGLVRHPVRLTRLLRLLNTAGTPT